MPPVKKGQRFGDLFSRQKVGLLSERRFLIFTKRGPIEISFKLSHYIGLALSIVVGFSSIIYYSVVGISSAIDVAQKDIITEASANLNIEYLDNNKNENETISELSGIIENETRQNYKKNDFESNIFIPHKKSDEKYYFKNFIENKLKKNDVSNTGKINDKDFINKIQNTETMLIDNIKGKDKIIDKDLKDNNEAKENNFFISPPKLDQRISNFRFISSLDNELSNLENVFKRLEINLKNPNLKKIKNLKQIQLDEYETNQEFLNIFRERLNLLSIYKDALEFIPLKPPMEHYYVTSKYGKRKHPVTKKWRFHHGIDLAGTWQENIRVSADGVVTFSGYHGSFGKVIRIKHNYGLATTYGHLSKILVKKGAIVSEGQVIGKMGKTGRVDGAHLHYEISVNGKSKNPAIYFKVGRMLLSRNSFKSIAKSD